MTLGCIKLTVKGNEDWIFPHQCFFSMSQASSGNLSITDLPFPPYILLGQSFMGSYFCWAMVQLFGCIMIWGFLLICDSSFCSIIVAHIFWIMVFFFFKLSKTTCINCVCLCTLASAKAWVCRSEDNLKEQEEEGGGGKTCNYILIKF